MGDTNEEALQSSASAAHHPDLALMIPTSTSQSPWPLCTRPPQTVLASPSQQPNEGSEEQIPLWATPTPSVHSPSQEVDMQELPVRPQLAFINVHVHSSVRVGVDKWS